MLALPYKYTKMDGCIEHTRVEGNKTITLYIRDDKVVAKRVNSHKGIYTKGKWFCDGVLHRDEYDLPAVICYENGQKISELWYRNGKKHRDGDLPAEIWYKNSQKAGELWYRDGIQYSPLRNEM